MKNRLALVLPGILLALVLNCRTSMRQPPAVPPANSGSASAAFRVGKNVPLVSNRPDLPVVEPHVSVHPSNPNLLLVGAMTVEDRDNPFESSRLTTFVSGDGGTTWRQRNLDYVGYDVWTAILPDNRAVLTWIGNPGKFSDTYPIRIFSSTDAGATWDSAVTTLKGDHDGSRMTVGGKTGRIYLSAAKFFHDAKGEMSVSAYFDVNPDGAAFNHPVLIDEKGLMFQITQPAELSDGTVLLAAAGRGHDEPPEKSRAWVHVSTDGGQTFSDPVRITDRVGSRKGYASLVADPGSAKFRDRVYYLRAVGHGDDFQGIVLNYSSDKGRTWSRDVRVDRFSAAGSSHAFVPAVVVNKDGVVGVSWMDRQTDPKGKRNDVYFTVSRDGGETFEPPVRVTDASADPVTPGNGRTATELPGGGHYAGLAARADGGFQLVWSDARTGAFQLYACTIFVNP